jgi:hypothetical protein
MLTLKLIKRKPSNQLLLAKFLFNAYREGLIKWSDQRIKLLLNETILALLEIKDPNFKSKYSLTVRKLAVLLMILNGASSFKIFRERVSKSEVNLSDLYLNKRQFLAAKKNLLPVIETWNFRLTQLKWNKVPPPRYIGVGYKDKGTRKKRSYDGSPSWQEVASSFSRSSFKDKCSWQEKCVSTLFSKTRPIYDESEDWIQLLRRRLNSTIILK